MPLWKDKTNNYYYYVSVRIGTEKRRDKNAEEMNAVSTPGPGQYNTLKALKRIKNTLQIRPESGI